MAERYAPIQIGRALALSRGDLLSARAYLVGRHGPHTRAEGFVTRQITDTDSIKPGDAALTDLGAFYVGLVQKQSLIGKIDAASPFYRTLADVPTLAQTAGASASWTQEAKPIPTGAEGFETMKLAALKLAVIVPFTVELLRAIGEQADAIVQRDLVNATAAKESESFADPASAGVDGMQPPSVFYGVDPIPASADLKADFATLFEDYPGDLSTAVLTMNPSDAISLTMAGIAENTLGATGGFAFGLPVATSPAVPQGDIGLIDPASIALVDLGAAVDASTQALLEADDGSGTTELVSLWQNNLSALRCIRYLNWQQLHDGSARYISGAFAKSA